MYLAHLTDLHLVSPGERLYGMDPVARLMSAIQSLNAVDGLDLVLITGDLAHRGEPAAYVALRRALERLRTPWLFAIGNHDSRTALRAAFPQAPIDEHGFFQTTRRMGDTRLIVLDTKAPGTHAGELCERRLAWLRNQLDADPSVRTIVAFHHPPLDLDLPAMDAIRLRDSEVLGDLLGHYDCVHHLLFGHVHRAVHGVWRGIAFSCQKGLNHQVALHSGPTSGIPGSLEGPAYSLIRVTPETTVVHACEFLTDNAAFDLFDPRAEGVATVADLQHLRRPQV
jgi:3',5'-cyclic-AMP phosphodiesterase